MYIMSIKIKIVNDIIAHKIVAFQPMLLHFDILSSIADEIICLALLSELGLVFHTFPEELVINLSL